MYKYIFGDFFFIFMSLYRSKEYLNIKQLEEWQYDNLLDLVKRIIKLRQIFEYLQYFNDYQYFNIVASNIF